MDIYGWMKEEPYMGMPISILIIFIIWKIDKEENTQHKTQKRNTGLVYTQEWSNR